MRESFVFYQSYYNSISELDDRVQLEVLKAIFEYALNGETIELSGVAKAIFMLIKPTLDANEKRYNNGKNGGRPKKTDEIESENKKPNQNQTVTKPKPNQNQTVTKGKPNVNVNVNVNANENVNENVNTPPKPPTGGERGKKKPESSACSEAFTAFWEAYPKKVSKTQAMKAWDKLNPNGETVRLILSALDAQKKCDQWQRDHGQFIPYPATWLNNRRWEDDISNPVTAQKAEYDYSIEGEEDGYL